MLEYQPIPMVQLTRANQLESMHYGWAVLVNSHGDIINEWGNSKVPIFPRSCLKPIQTMAVVASGAADKFHLSDQQLALASASHEGENIHQSMVLDWLKQLGCNENSLTCGSAWPGQREARYTMIVNGASKKQSLHNCSGKHCGQLSICKHQGWPIEHYNDIEHPAQKFCLDILNQLSGTQPYAIGVDGCTLPAPQMQLYHFAYALARMSDPDCLQSNVLSKAATKVLEAAINHPVLAGGASAPNSLLTQAGTGSFFAKNGAEGVYAVISREHKQALVLKISDGTKRAADCAAASLIKQLHWANNKVIQSFAEQPLYNSAKKQIGLMHWAA